MFASVGFVSADTATANPSTYHKAYYFAGDTSYSWGDSGTELSGGSYDAIASSDDSRVHSQGNIYFPYLRADFNVGRIANANGFVISDITNMNILIEGYATCSYFTCRIYDDTDSLWRSGNSSEINGIFTRSNSVGAVDVLLTFDINGSIDDYISASNILKISTGGGNNPTGDSSDVYIDTITLTITYTPTPTSPSLIAPTNGGTGYSITPDFDWGASSGGTAPYTYELKVDDDISFDSMAVNVIGISDSNFTCTSTLNSDTLYYWKVRAKDDDGAYSAWSSPYSFSTLGLIAPVLVSPTNGGTGYSITPDFDWNVSTGGTSPYTYEIKVDDGILFLTPTVDVTGLSDSNYSYTTGLTPATTYYWKVRTLDACSTYSSWATTQNFTTASFTSPTFTLPTAGTVMTTATPTFTWSASTGGSGTYTYELAVSLVNTFATTVLNQTGIATTSYTMTSNLTPDTYYARIRAKDSLNNYSSWSSTVSFTATAPTSGGSSSTSTSEQAPYVPLVLPTTDDDTVTTTASDPSTNFFTKYIINPVKTVVINPMRNFFAWIWESLMSLVHGSSQDELIPSEAKENFNDVRSDAEHAFEKAMATLEELKTIINGIVEDIKESEIFGRLVNGIG
jgi:hypothetical protein